MSDDELNGIIIPLLDKYPRALSLTKPGKRRNGTIAPGGSLCRDDEAQTNRYGLIMELVRCGASERRIARHLEIGNSTISKAKRWAKQREAVQ